MTRVVAALSFLAVLGVAVFVAAPDSLLRELGGFFQTVPGFISLVFFGRFLGQFDLALRETADAVRAARRMLTTRRARRERQLRNAREARHAARLEVWWKASGEPDLATAIAADLTARPDPAANQAA